MNLGALTSAPNAEIFVEALTWGTPTGSTTPGLYAIGTAGDMLVAINTSNGLMTAVGPIPAFAGSNSGAGFTYSNLTGTAYVAFPQENSDGVSDQVLYTIDLRTGETALVGIVDDLPGGELQIAAGAVLTGPSCRVSGIVAGPPKQLNVAVQDTTSGLKSIDLVSSVNGSVNIPVFSRGTTNPVLVTATKVDQTQSSDFALLATDVGGLTTSCDPVDFTVTLDGCAERHIFRSVNPAEHYLRITNGIPGVQQMTHSS